MRAAVFMTAIALFAGGAQAHAYPHIQAANHTFTGGVQTWSWGWNAPRQPVAPHVHKPVHIAHKTFHHRRPRVPLPGAVPTVEPADETEKAASAPAAAQDDRAYLAATAHPGFTMLAQGVQVALSCLHPTFVTRLAAAIREARLADIPAAIFSACRPPDLHVGGFANKFRSMHAYGLAVDMAGIGGPGSATSQRWHAIAEAHKVYGVYGPAAGVEWNHYQATRVLSAPPALQRTITAAGPRTLGGLYKAAMGIIDKGPPERAVRHHRGKHEHHYA